MKIACTFLSFGLLLSLSHAANWPCFRGPDGTASSEDSQVPTHWSATENMRWKLDLPGPGASSPIVWGDRVFVTCFSGQEDSGDTSKLVRHVICVDRKSGTKIWQKDFPTTQREDPWTGNIREHGYTSNTPVTDGAKVIAHFGKGGVVALDFDGKVLWQAATGSDSNRMHWGSAGSPALWKNLVIVNASDEAQSLIAFDTATGQQVWKQRAEPLGMAFSSPHLMNRGDGREDLLFSAPGELWGMNPETGKLRWFAETGINGNVSPDPVVIGDVVYVSGGFPSTAQVALRAGKSGEVSASDVLWRSNSATYVPSPLAYDGHLYIVNDSGTALCMDAKTGDVVFNERLSLGSQPQAAAAPNPAAGRGGPGGGGRRGGGMGGRGKPVYASPVRIAGNIYAVTRKQGTVILAAKPQYTVVATNRIEGDETDFNAAPAISDGNLFLRSNKALYCIGAK